MRYALPLLLACLFLPQGLLAQTAHQLDSLRQLAPTQTGTALTGTYLAMAMAHVELTATSDSMFHYAQRARARTQDQDSLRAHCYLVLGHLHARLSAYDSSDHWLLRGLAAARAQGDQPATAQALTALGKNALLRDAYPEALQYFLDALSLETTAPTARLAGLRSNIGLIYGNMGQVAEGLPYLRQALALARQARDTLTLLQVTNNLALFHGNLDALDSCAYYAEALVAMSDAAALPQGRIRGRLLLAETRVLQGDPQAGLSLAAAAAHLVDPTMIALTSNVYSALARIQDTLGQYREAIETGHRHLDLARQTQEPIKVMYAYEDLAKFYHHAGDYRQAWFFTRQYHHLKDSLFSAEKTAALQRLQTEFETREKEQAIANLEQEARMQALQLRQRGFALAGLALLAILGAGLVWLIHRRRLWVQQTLAMEARQQALRSQMNPHFLFHALSAIQAFIYEAHDPGQAGIFLAKYAKLMRLILENSRADFISLDQELQTLGHYLALQQVRYRQAFTYHIHLDPRLDPEAVFLPPMLAQPFIENALEHGQLHTQPGGRLDLSYRREGDRLVCVVADNGIGRRAATLSGNAHERRSLATAITRDRLRLLERQLRQPVTFEISDTGDAEGENSGTRVTFVLPLRDAPP